MKTKKQTIKLIIWVLFLISIIGTIWFLSEPKYINGDNKKAIEKYDLVTYKYRSYREELAIVLQVSDEKILLKEITGYENFHHVMKKDYQDKVIGRGTIYHKVNMFVGFNLMIISQFALVIIMIILIMVNASLLSDFFKV